MKNLNRSQRKRLYGAAFVVAWLLLGAWLLGPVERGVRANDRNSHTSYTVFGAMKYFYIIHEGVDLSNRPVPGYYRRLHFDPGRFAITLAIVVTYSLAFLVAWHIAVHRRRLAARCDGCGYLIMTSSEVCPECGEPIDHDWYRRQVSEGSWLARTSLRIDRWLRLHERKAMAVALLACWLFLMWIVWGVGSKTVMNGEVRRQDWGAVTWLEYSASGTGGAGEYELQPKGLFIAVLITLITSAAGTIAWRKAVQAIRQRCPNCGCDLAEIEGARCPVCGAERT